MVARRYIYYAGTLGAMWLASKLVEKSPEYIKINRKQLDGYIKYIGLSTKVVFNFIKLFESGILTREIVAKLIYQFKTHPLYKFVPKAFGYLLAQILVFGLFLESLGGLQTTHKQIKSKLESPVINYTNEVTRQF